MIMQKNKHEEAKQLLYFSKGFEFDQNLSYVLLVDLAMEFARHETWKLRYSKKAGSSDKTIKLVYFLI